MCGILANWLALVVSSICCAARARLRRDARGEAGGGGEGKEVGWHTMNGGVRESERALILREMEEEEGTTVLSAVWYGK